MLGSVILNKQMMRILSLMVIFICFGFLSQATAQIGKNWLPYYPETKLQQENSTQHSSYTNENGVESFKLWLNPATDANGKAVRQRCEIRVMDDYTAGQTQFEGEFFITKAGGPERNDDVCIMQVWLSHIVSVSDLDNGSVHYKGKQVIHNLKNKWVKLNVIHNTNTKTVDVYFDGKLTYTAEAKDSNPYYHKYGLYNEADANPEIKWRNIKYFKTEDTVINSK